jgi:hypothetical protein
MMVDRNRILATTILTISLNSEGMKLLYPPILNVRKLAPVKSMNNNPFFIDLLFVIMLASEDGSLVSLFKIFHLEGKNEIITIT